MTSHWPVPQTNAGLRELHWPRGGVHPVLHQLRQGHPLLYVLRVCVGGGGGLPTGKVLPGPIGIVRVSHWVSVAPGAVVPMLAMFAGAELWHGEPAITDGC